MIQDFKNKTAVLTGAGSGFGLECARIGAAHGIYGFRAFSHERAVLQDRWFILHWLFPPYTGMVKRLIAVVVRVLG